MKLIVINPHNASREELKKLKKYLKKNCWDYKKDTDGKIKFREL